MGLTFVAHVLFSLYSAAFKSSLGQFSRQSTIKPEIKAVEVDTLWVFNLTMKKKNLPFHVVQWLPNMSVHLEALGP